MARERPLFLRLLWGNGNSQQHAFILQENETREIQVCYVCVSCCSRLSVYSLSGNIIYICLHLVGIVVAVTSY